MTTNPKVISENALAARALNLMEFFNITCLIIINGERKPIGIVHLHDLLKAGVV
jgi:arabinose-5-phosphate isomerase